MKTNYTPEYTEFSIYRTTDYLCLKKKKKIDTR